MLTKKELLEIRNKINRPFILDGALGSLLLKSNIKSRKDKLWGTITDKREIFTLENIYSQYVNSGADILTTNTFRTNPSSVAHYNLDSKIMVKLNAEITVALAHNNDLLAAGSNPPAEDCYSPTRTLSKNMLERNHKYHIDYLIESGVDFILNETQSHFDEIKIISEYCSSNSINYLVSLYFEPDGRILSGQSIFEAVKLCLNYSPTAILINCIDKNTFSNYWDKLFDLGVNGYYLNCFDKSRTSEEENFSDEKSYGIIVSSSYNNDIFLIGSCCGSDYKFTKEIKSVINEFN